MISSYLGNNEAEQRYLPGRLNAILCGFDKKWKLVLSCDVDHSSVVVNRAKMDSSTADT